MPDLLESYTVLERIAQGGEADVSLVEKDGQCYIAKQYRWGEVTQYHDIVRSRTGAEKEIAFLTYATKQGRTDIPRLIEFGTTGRYNDPVVIMEYIQGETLEQRMARADFVPTVEEALDLATQVGQTLTYAHRQVGTQPFIHRDVKPANIMIKEDGSVVVLDWSGAKVGGGRTLDNTMFGSLMYASAEVRGGETVSTASDIFGLARTFQHYFLGDEFVEVHGEVTSRHFANKPIPRTIVDTLMQATSLDPVSRNSIEDFVNGLQGETIMQRGDHQELEYQQRSDPMRELKQLSKRGIFSRAEKMGILYSIATMSGLLYLFGDMIPETWVSTVAAVAMGSSMPIGKYFGNRVERILNKWREQEEPKVLPSYEKETDPVRSFEPVETEDHNPLEPPFPN